MKARIVRVVHNPGTAVVHVRDGRYSVLKYDAQQMSLKTSDEIEGDFAAKGEREFTVNGTGFSAKVVRIDCHAEDPGILPIMVSYELAT